MTILPKKCLSPNGEYLAYHIREFETPKPGVMFLGGFASDMTGSKATFLEQYCVAEKQSYLRFDYSGHGTSEGKFEEGSIGKWYQEALFMCDTFTSGPQILVGSSMGGWIALLLALARPKKIAGLIGIAAAPDFTEHLIWERLSEAQRHTLKKEGKIEERFDEDSDPYFITDHLIQEAREHLLLHKKIPLSCPARLLHGTEDLDVPWDISLRLMQQITHPQTELTLLKNGDHRLSSDENLQTLAYTLSTLTKTVAVTKTER